MSLTKPTKIEINKTLVVLAVLIIAMAGVLPSLFATPEQEEIEIDLSDKFTKDVLKLSPILTVTVYDSNGNLKSTQVKEDDLIVNNFRDWLQALFTTGTSVTASLTNDANTTKTVNIRSGTYANSWLDSATGSGTKGGVAGIGTGTTAAARTDYALETQVEADATQFSGFPQYSTSTGIITMSFSFPITDTHAITEAVFGCNWVASDASENTFILFHDVFSAVNVVNGDTLVLGYTLTLTESGFSNNFGQMLNAIFSSVNDGSVLGFNMDNSVTATESSHISYTYQSTSGYYGFVVTTPSNNNVIAVGTSSTATSRAHYGVQTAVEALTTVNTPTVGTGTVVVQTDITCVSARVITEAAFFIGSDIDVGSGKYNLMWRAVFAGVSVDAGKAIRITFTLTL